jgi:hypothetical protein
MKFAASAHWVPVPARVHHLAAISDGMLVE